jgi:hypothetical protein
VSKTNNPSSRLFVRAPSPMGAEVVRGKVWTDEERAQQSRRNQHQPHADAVGDLLRLLPVHGRWRSRPAGQDEPQRNNQARQEQQRG